MSYSFTKSGKITEIRAHLAAANYSGESPSARLAKHVINSELDLLELKGATHARLSASGGAGSHNITVQRDYDAESAYLEQQKAERHARLQAEASKEGFVLTPAGAVAQSYSREDHTDAKGATVRQDGAFYDRKA